MAWGLVCVSQSPDFPGYTFDTISSQPSNPPIELIQALIDNA